jgi:hypothetical protein
MHILALILSWEGDSYVLQNPNPETTLHKLIATNIPDVDALRAELFFNGFFYSSTAVYPSHFPENATLELCRSNLPIF